MKQQDIPCIGGPLDGQIWPAGKGAPAVPLIPYAKNWVPIRPKTHPVDTSPLDSILHYKMFRMRHCGSGRHLDVFAPDFLTSKDVGRRLDMRLPDGPQS